MWVWKRMAKVSWRAMTTNEDVLQVVQRIFYGFEEEIKLDR